MGVMGMLQVVAIEDQDMYKDYSGPDQQASGYGKTYGEIC